MQSSPKFDILGNGWNTFENIDRNQIINYTYYEGGSSTECNVHECNSIEDIAAILDISGSVDIRHSLAKVETKASFLKDCSKKSESITLLVKVKRTWKATIDSAEFSKDQKWPSTIQDAKNLVKYAGDSYINHIEVGVEYYAAYQFNASTTAEKKTISAEIHAQAGKLMTVDVSTSAVFDSIQSATKSSYTFLQTLIGADRKLPAQNKAIEFALELTGGEITNTELLSFTTLPYSILPGAPSGISDIDQRIEVYVQPQPGWFTYSVRAIEMQTKIALSISQGVQSLYKFYNAGEEFQKKLADHCAECIKVIQTIEEWKFKINPNSKIWNASEALKKPEIDVNVLKIPHPNFELVYGAKWGRQEGGSKWSDFDERIVYSYGYPKTFQCKAGLVLDSITTVYGYRDPKDPENSSKETTHSEKHGGSGGSDLDFGYRFSPDQDQVAAIGLWSKSWQVPGESQADFDRYRGLMCGFELYLRSKPESLMIGKSDGHYHKEDNSDQSFFLGFQGRAQEQIDSLQPVYVKFKNPTWSPSLPKA